MLSVGEIFKNASQTKQETSQERYLASISSKGGIYFLCCLVPIHYWVKPKALRKIWHLKLPEGLQSTKSKFHQQVDSTQQKNENGLESIFVEFYEVSSEKKYESKMSLKNY